MSESICPNASEPSRSKVWIHASILSVSIPAAILVLQTVARYLNSLWSLSLIQRYCMGVTALCGGEWIVMTGFLIWWRPKRKQMQQIGFTRIGTISAWIVALGITFLSLFNGLRLLKRFGIPASSIWSLRGYHVYAALLIGCTAAICEETIFRGFMMTEFASVGYSKAMQVVVPGLFFGVAHFGMLKQGIAAGLGTIVPTTIMGMIWGISYLLGRRSVLPSMVAHFFNDATVLPWILFFFMTHGVHLLS